MTTANVRASYSGSVSPSRRSELDVWTKSEIPQAPARTSKHKASEAARRTMAMSFSEHSKITGTSWSRHVEMLARRVGLPNTSARFPISEISTRPRHSTAILRIRGGLSPKTLRRVQDHIAANLGQKITNQALAQVANLSPSHFARAFKDSQGVAPHQYILERRVKRAQELLAADLSLSEIAFEVGFSDQSHLTRWFREFVGVTPGSYRWSIR